MNKCKQCNGGGGFLSYVTPFCRTWEIYITATNRGEMQLWCGKCGAYQPIEKEYKEKHNNMFHKGKECKFY